MSYQPDLYCDGCGHRGGFDCQGDVLCGDCMASEMSLEEESKPYSAAMYFYHDDPESMRRFRKIQQVDNYHDALFDFIRWLRNEIKYLDHEEYQRVINELCGTLELYGIDPWEE